MKKAYRKYFSLLVLFLFITLLSACSGEMQGHSEDFTDATLTAYNPDGQESEKLNFNSVKVKDDPNIDSAIDLLYGQNKIIFSNASLLLTEKPLINYCSRYKAYLKKQPNFNQNTFDPAAITAGNIYNQYLTNTSKHKNAVVIKNSQGALIGLFVARNLELKQLSAGDNNSTLIINLDENRVFAYNASYAVYPISALKAMFTKHNASNFKQQKTVKTKQTPPADKN